MSNTIGNLLIKVGGDNTSFTEFIEKMEAMKEAVSGFLEALAVIEGVKFLVELGEQFEEAEIKIRQATGAMGAELESLNETFKDVFVNVPQSMDDVTSAVVKLSQTLDLVGPPLEEITTQVLNLARVTGSQVTPLVDSLAHVFAQWKLDTDQQTESMDHFLQVVQASGAPLQGMADALAQFGPSLRAAGIGLEEATDLFGQLTKAGLNGATAFQSIQRAVQNLSKEGITDIAGGMQALSNAIKNAGNDATAFEIGAQNFGRGSNLLVAAIRDGSIDLENFQTTLELSGQKVNDLADQTLTLGQQWSTFSHQLMGDFEPALKAIVALIQGALNEVENLYNTFQQLATVAKHIGQGELPQVSFEGETDKEKQVINDLLAKINDNNLTLGAKPIKIPLVFPSDNKDAEDYITMLQNATKGLKDVGDASDAAAASTTKVATAQKTTADATAAALIQYKLLQSQLKTLKEQLDVASAGRPSSILQLQITDLRRQVLAPNAADADTQWLAYYNEVITLAHKSNQQVSDDTIAAYFAMQQKVQADGMDTLNALATLGLKTTGQIQGQIDGINEAYAQLSNSALLSADDKFRALIADTTQIIALSRTIGKDIPDDMLIWLANAQTQWKVLHMDIQQAFQDLGITSQQDALNGLQVSLAAVDKIEQSFMNGTATANDVINAQIAALQKQQKAFGDLGIAMTDADVTLLAFLTTQKQIQAMTTSGAFTTLGLPSPDQINTSTDLMLAAYAKVVAAVGADSTQADAAWAAFLNDQVKKTQQAGIQISTALAQASEAANAQVQLNAVNFVNAMSSLNVGSQQQLTETITLIQKQMDAALAGITAGSVQANQIVLNGLTQIQQAYQKAGIAVPQALENQLSALSTAVKSATLTLQGAYQQLGLTSTQTLQQQIALSQQALNILQQENAPLDLQLQGWQKLYQQQLQFGAATGATANEMLALTEKLGGVQSQLSAIAISSQGLSNLYTGLKKAFGDAWTSFEMGIGDAIAGAKSWSDAWRDAVSQLEKSLSELVVKFFLDQLKNAILTNTNLLGDFNKAFNFLFAGGGTVTSTLASTQKAIADTTADMSGYFKSFGADMKSTLDQSSQSIKSVTSQTNSGVASMTQSALTSLSQIFGMVTGAISAIAGVVGDIEMGHMEKTLGQIETNTRIIYTLIQESDGVQVWTKATGMAVQDVRELLSGQYWTLALGMSSDLDGIGTNTTQMVALLEQLVQGGVVAGGGGGGGGGGSTTNNVQINDALAALEGQIDELRKQVNYLNLGAGASANSFDTNATAVGGAITSTNNFSSVLSSTADAASTALDSVTTSSVAFAGAMATASALSDIQALPATSMIAPALNLSAELPATQQLVAATNQGGAAHGSATNPTQLAPAPTIMVQTTVTGNSIQSQQQADKLAQDTANKVITMLRQSVSLLK